MRFASLYNDFIEGKVQEGEDPLSPDSVREFNTAPDKEEKKRILEEQLNKREKQKDEKQRSKTVLNERHKQNLQSLEQRYQAGLSQFRQKQKQTMSRTMTVERYAQKELELYKQPKSPKRKKKGKKEQKPVEDPMAVS